MILSLFLAASVAVAAPSGGPKPQAPPTSAALTSPLQQPTPSSICAAGKDAAVVPWQKTMTEAEREAMAAALFLTFDTPRASGDWPFQQFRTTPPCQVSQLKISDGFWSLNAGAGGAPPLWAVSLNHGYAYFVAAGPPPSDAASQLGSPWHGEPSSRRAYYLAAKRMDGNETRVITMFSALPSSQQIADAIIKRDAGESDDFAIFSDKGGAVSILAKVEGGRQAQIFRPADDGHGIETFGADGTYFLPGANGRIRMETSGFVCPPKLTTYQRLSLDIAHSHVEDLNIGCWYQKGEALFGMYVLRVQDASDDRALFQRRFAIAKQDFEVRELTQSRYRSGYQSATWENDEGQRAVMSLMRFGDWVLELTLMNVDETGADYKALLDEVFRLKNEEERLRDAKGDEAARAAPLTTAQASGDLKAR